MFSFGLVQFNFPPENLGELKASMALLLHTRMIPIFAPTPEDLRVRDQCGEHAMVLCGSRDGYWLFQDSYGLSRGEIGVIKVRKGRRTVVRSKIQFLEKKKLKLIQFKRNMNETLKQWRTRQMMRNFGAGLASKQCTMMISFVMRCIIPLILLGFGRRRKLEQRGRVGWMMQRRMWPVLGV
ncbi:hypothetical protein F2Q68_00029076 [Brassica cretica]|uniref:Uncharacterized protein n=1 Tax=Brassica cretica TaxID=69181 RepID=A0A8S9GFR9_BRACR|nr:hypothetical protein F2Q68_00029076 [Brassica cretica]